MCSRTSAENVVVGEIMMIPDEIVKRVEQYEKNRQLVVESCLGAGTQSTVYVLKNSARSQRIAIKFHYRETAYQRERDVAPFNLRNCWTPTIVPATPMAQQIK
jgi:hypothetical protein